jgi:hypothetical protein
MDDKMGHELDGRNGEEQLTEHFSWKTQRKEITWEIYV